MKFSNQNARLNLVKIHHIHSIKNKEIYAYLKKKPFLSHEILFTQNKPRLHTLIKKYDNTLRIN